MPQERVISRWRDKHDWFSLQYAQAKTKQVEILVEEIVDISDDGSNDWMETVDKDEQSIGWKVNGEHVQRSRLRIDTRKWLASKLAPKIYGDRLQVNTTNDEESEQLKAELKELREKLAEQSKRDF